MKKKQFVAILLAAILMLALAATALAFSLSRSAHATAVRAAREAVCAQYGFTAEVFGLFVERRTQEGQRDDRIIFDASGADEERLGSYTVELSPGEQPKVAWTHDGVNLAELATRGLDSPVWGHVQAERVLALKKAQMEKSIEMQSQMGYREDWTLADWAEADAVLTKPGDFDALYYLHILPLAEDIQEAQAIALAKTAVQKKYGLTAEQLSAYKAITEFIRWKGEEEPAYSIRLVAAEATPSDSLGSFEIKIASPSGEIKRCRWFVYAGDWTLPTGSLAGYPEAVEEFVRDGGFSALSAKAKADVGKRIIEAGFGELIGNVAYVMPDAAAMPELEALRIAREALLAYGFTEEGLLAFDATPSLQQSGEEAVWVVRFVPNEYRFQDISHNTDILGKLGEYTVTLQAHSGATQPVEWSLSGQGEGKAYTAQNWGTAPALSVKELPLLLELEGRFHAVYDKMEEVNIPTLEEQAALDGMFRDAGFDRKLFRGSLPGPEHLTREAALKIALQAITEEYGVAESDLRENYVLFEGFDVADPERPEWYFGPQNADGWYGVTLDAKTGEILYVNYMTGGNG